MGAIKGKVESKMGSPGVSAMSVYVPRLRVRLEDWCAWTDNSWPKIQSVVGRSFRVPNRHENVYTMAANAVLRLIINNDVDPREVGFWAWVLNPAPTTLPERSSFGAWLISRCAS